MIVYLKIWLISFETSHVVLKKCFQKPMIEASLSCFCLQRECFQGCHVTDNICCKFLANSFYQIKEYSSNPGLVRFIILKEYYILLKAFSVSLMRRVKFISSLSLLRSFSFFLSMKHEFYWIAFLPLLTTKISLQKFEAVIHHTKFKKNDAALFIIQYFYLIWIPSLILEDGFLTKVFSYNYFKIIYSSAFLEEFVRTWS